MLNVSKLSLYEHLNWIKNNIVFLPVSILHMKCYNITSKVRIQARVSWYLPRDKLIAIWYKFAQKSFTCLKEQIMYKEHG